MLCSLSLQNSSSRETAATEPEAVVEGKESAGATAAGDKLADTACCVVVGSADAAFVGDGVVEGGKADAALAGDEHPSAAVGVVGDVGTSTVSAEAAGFVEE